MLRVHADSTLFRIQFSVARAMAWSGLIVDELGGLDIGHWTLDDSTHWPLDWTDPEPQCHSTIRPFDAAQLDNTRHGSTWTYLRLCVWGSSGLNCCSTAVQPGLAYSNGACCRALLPPDASPPQTPCCPDGPSSRSASAARPASLQRNSSTAPAKPRGNGSLIFQLPGCPGIRTRTRTPGYQPGHGAYH